MVRAAAVLSILGGVVLAGLGVVFYTPLPPHLENWWQLQLFMAKFKLVFMGGELKYRFGSRDRMTVMRQTLGSFMKADLTQADRDTLEIYDKTLNGVSVRVYKPKATVGKLPGLVYFHGGAWQMFSVDAYDGVCAHLARTANIIVVSVEYRLAPEFPFPAGFEDCLTVAKFVLQNGATIGIDTNRVAVGGDSAGGNLAAAVTLELRDQHIQPALKAQLIVYGSLQFCHVSLPEHVRRESYGGKQIQIFTYFLGTYLKLSRPQMDLIDAEKFLTPKMKEKCDKLVDVSLVPKNLIPDGYTPSNHVATTITDDVRHINSFLDDRRLAPLMTEDLSNLPSSLVVAAEWDTLRDENIMYAERLKMAGNKARLFFLDGSFHGVIQKFQFEKDGFEAGPKLMNEIVDFLNKELKD